MKDTFFFSHDYNARVDDKIKPLIRKHGMLGYGIFWAIIEDLYNNANALRTDYEGIAFDMRVDESVVESIVTGFGLFVINDGFFGSLAVEERLNKRNEKSTKARESANNRWKNNANAIQSQCERIDNSCEGNAIKERKGKEIIEKDNKENLIPHFENSGISILENEKDILSEPEQIPLKTFEPKKEKSSAKKEETEKLETPPFKGVETLRLWQVLIKGKKWQKKANSAVNLALKQLTRYDNEEFICGLLEKAIAGDYQGVVYPDTDEHYKKFLIKKQNEANFNQTSAPKDERYAGAKDSLVARMQAAHDKHTSNTKSIGT